jgi:hypothetical protein
MSSNKDDDQATDSLVGSKVRVQKIAAADNPAFKTPSWEEHVPGAPNEGESLPSGYTVTGTLKSYVEEGNRLVVLRDTRNGEEISGVMQTSEIQCVEEKQGTLCIETQNSVYCVSPLVEPTDFASGPKGAWDRKMKRDYENKGPLWQLAQKAKEDHRKGRTMPLPGTELSIEEHFLFLDDTREPEDVYPDTAEEWDHVTGPDGFKEYLLHAPQKRLVISFDHDLGTEETGMDLAKWMARQGIKPAEYKVHSANVSGAENMRRFLNGWMKHGERGEPWDPEQAMQNLADQAQDLGMHDSSD